MDLEFKSPQHVLEEVRAMRVEEEAPLDGQLRPLFCLLPGMGNTIRLSLCLEPLMK